MSSQPTRAAYLSWVAICVIWGTTYLAIRVALETIPPGLLGGIRFTVAGLLLCAYVRASGERLPAVRAWPGLVVVGFLMLAVGNGAVVVAEQWIPSGIAAVGVASAPFWMTGIDALAGGERVTGRMLAGFALGFGGIVILIWPDLLAGGSGGSHFIAGVVLVQLACLGWSIGSSISKRATNHGSPIASSAMQQLFGGLIMLAIATATGEWSRLAFSPRSLGAELYLIAFGSIGAFSAYIYALQHMPIATLSLYTYVNPVIAVVLGTLLLGEPFSSRIVVAAALVLAGIAVVRAGHAPQERRGK